MDEPDDNEDFNLDVDGGGVYNREGDYIGNGDDVTLAYEEELIMRRTALSNHSTSSGAGAILFSSLVYQGWRLPPFLLVQTDEKYLFELEVKVKLSHVSCGPALMDALVDFPPHVLISRAGLLQAMLDVLGSPLSLSTEDAGMWVWVGGCRGVGVGVCVGGVCWCGWGE
jgi:hypothetical protein